MRKIVSVLFCDIVGSTAIAEQADPEVVREIMVEYFARARRVLAQHGGTIEKFIGDAVVAVFGMPRAREDDAFHAVRAALELQAAVAAITVPVAKGRAIDLVVRIGIETGLVVTGDPATGSSFVSGDAVNVAARLQTLAAPGAVVIGQVTRQLIRDSADLERLGAHRLKGREGPVEVYRVIGVHDTVRRFDTGGGEALVGRSDEVTSIVARYQATVASRRSGRVAIVGPAGIGKTRLATEVMKAATEDVRVLRGHALSYGDGVTYWALGEVIRAAAGIGDQDDASTATERLVALCSQIDHGDVIAERLAAAFGLTVGTASADDIAWAARSLFAALANDGPVVIVWDDLEHAEDALLQLIAALDDIEAPVFSLCLARPEIRDGPAGATMIESAGCLVELGSLGPDELSALVDAQPGAAALDASVKSRLVELAAGNPLFVEEFVATLADEGIVYKVDGVWHGLDSLSDITIPPTVAAVVAARLEALSDTEQQVLSRASVAGTAIETDALVDISPPQEQSPIPAALAVLEHKELLLRDRSTITGDGSYRFRHVLIRDRAYDTLIKRERAELHERFASWLERAAGGRLREYEEIVAHHLVASHTYRREFGDVDEHVALLAERGIGYLLRAAVRADLIADHPAAERLLSTVLDLLPVADSRRTEMEERRALAAAGVMESAGDYGAAEEIYREIRNETGSPRAWRGVCATLRRRGRYQEALDESDAALGSAPSMSSDIAGIRLERGHARSLLGDFGGAIKELRAGLDATGPGDDGLAGRLLLQWMRAEAVLGRHQEALARGKEAARRLEAMGDLAGQATALRLLGDTYRVLGDLDAAAVSLRRGLALARSRGDIEETGGCLINLALVESARGRLAEGIELDREAVDLFERVGHASGRAVAYNNLAEKLGAIGATEEALGWLSKALELAADIGHRLAVGDARDTRSVILVSAGRFEEAAADAESAATIFEELAVWDSAATALGRASAAWARCGDEARAASADIRFQAARANRDT